MLFCPLDESGIGIAVHHVVAKSLTRDACARNGGHIASKAGGSGIDDEVEIVSELFKAGSANRTQVIE